MKRRQFITLVGGAAAWPLATRAQQSTMPVIGVLNSGSPGSFWEGSLRVFRQALAGAGFVEGRNVAMEYRWAENQYDRLPELAADLVRRQAAVIVANYPSVLAAKAATTTIPIVFIAGGDPVQQGLVTSLSRPGGNLTGVSNLNRELLPKRLQLARELIPAATLIAILINPTNPAAELQSGELQDAAQALGMQIQILHASAERDFDAVFETLAQLRPGALLIGTDAFFIDRSEQLGALTARHSVLAIFEYRSFAAAGGLMSYGGNSEENYRLLGAYTARILKGEKPADLPIQQSTKVELIVNLKTAKALGLSVPTALLVRADEVIE